MAMSYEFVSGNLRKKRFFEILLKSDKRNILESLKLPETEEELKEYNEHREQIRELYETLENFDYGEHVKVLAKTWSN